MKGSFLIQYPNTEKWVEKTSTPIISSSVGTSDETLCSAFEITFLDAGEIKTQSINQLKQVTRTNSTLQLQMPFF